MTWPRHTCLWPFTYVNVPHPSWPIQAKNIFDRSNEAFLGVCRQPNILYKPQKFPENPDFEFFDIYSACLLCLSLVDQLCAHNKIWPWVWHVGTQNLSLGEMSLFPGSKWCFGNLVRNRHPGKNKTFRHDLTWNRKASFERSKKILVNLIGCFGEEGCGASTYPNGHRQVCRGDAIEHFQDRQTNVPF